MPVIERVHKVHAKNLSFFWESGILWLAPSNAGAVCDQKTSKFFVSHQEKSMAGHMDVKGVY
jgi:hypothetical protein